MNSTLHQSISLFIGLTGDNSSADRNRIARKALIIAFFIMMLLEGIHGAI